jgi:hypothetical protein
MTRTGPAAALRPTLTGLRKTPSTQYSMQIRRRQCLPAGRAQAAAVDLAASPLDDSRRDGYDMVG